MFKFKATADATDPVVLAAREDADNRRETVDLRPTEYADMPGSDSATGVSDRG